MSTKMGMNVYNTDTPVFVISRIQHQEQEWNERIYGSKVLVDTVMKYGATKTLCSKHFCREIPSIPGNAPDKLRVNNRA